MSSISGVSGGTNAWSTMGTSRASRQQEMFKKVDSDGSGSVDTNELQSMLDDIAKHTGTSATTTAAEALTKMDSNGDGSLDASELASGMKDILPKPSSTMAFAQARHGQGGTQGAGGPPPPPSDAGGTSSTSGTSFDPLDTNQDGTVSEQERAAGDMQNAIQDLLKAADTDGDHKISDSEFDNFKDMLSNAVSDLTAPSSSSSSTSTSSNGGGSNSSQGFNLSSLTNMVLKEYAKAASNAASMQSTGSTLHVAA